MLIRDIRPFAKLVVGLFSTVSPSLCGSFDHYVHSLLSYALTESEIHRMITANQEVVNTWKSHNDQEV